MAFVETLRFIRHLPDYYRYHMVRAKTRGSVGAEILKLPVADGVSIYCPNNAITFSQWEWHLWHEHGAIEIERFLELARGASRLLDIGAAEGFFSAVFAQSRPVGTIHAVEPVPKLCELSRKTRELNKRGMIWQVHNAAISDQNTSSTLGGDADFKSVFSGSLHVAPLDQKVEVMTLETFCDQQNFVPDLIKIDTEGFERNIILSSMEWLKRHRPRVHLELHNTNIESRGHSVSEFLEPLLEYYRVTHAMPRNFRAASLSRLQLVPK